MSSLRTAAESGNRLETLRSLRDTLAGQIDACESGRDMAALSRQLTDVLSQIASLAPEQKAGDPVDEIAARRASRRAGSAAGSPRSGKVTG